MKYTTMTYKKAIKIIRPELTVIDEYAGITTKIQHNCNKCNDIWVAQPRQVLSNRQCRKCYEKRISSSLELFKQKTKITNPKFKIIGDYKNSRTPIEIKHSCGYTFSATPNRLIQHTIICRRCHPVKRVIRPTSTITHLGIFDSKFESRCAEILVDKFGDDVEFSRHYDTNPNKTCDFYIKSQSLWIEVSTYNKPWYLERIYKKRRLVNNFYFAQSEQQLNDFIINL